MDVTQLRKYEQAVYIYWLGGSLPTVKIGHTNDPERRLSEFRRETGTPGHKAGFAAIVWLDRSRERVEAAAHRAAAAFRRDGEWFELSPSDAIDTVVAAAKAVGANFAVEDCAGVWGETLRRRAAEQAARETQVEQARRAAIHAEREAERKAQAEREARAEREAAAARAERIAVAQANAEQAEREERAAVINREAARDALALQQEMKERDNRALGFWLKTTLLASALGSVYFVVGNYLPSSLLSEKQAHAATAASLETTTEELKALKREHAKLASSSAAIDEIVSIKARCVALGSSQCVTLANAEFVRRGLPFTVGLPDTLWNKPFPTPEPVIKTVVKTVHVEAPKPVVQAKPAEINPEERVERARKELAKARAVCEELRGYLSTMDACVGAGSERFNDAKRGLAKALAAN